MGQAIRLQPDEAVFHYFRGNFNWKLAEYDQAIADLTEAIRLDPKNAEYVFARGQAYKIDFQFEKAIADFDATLRLDLSYRAAKQARYDTFRERDGSQ